MRSVVVSGREAMRDYGHPAPYLRAIISPGTLHALILIPHMRTHGASEAVTAVAEPHIPHTHAREPSVTLPHINKL